jgi:cytidylate kinase
MSINQLLGITGFARSGKSELIRYISREYGFEVVHASGVLATELRKETGRENFSREELRQKGEELRRLQGPDFIVKTGLTQNSSQENVLFDGIRNLRAAKTLVSQGGVLIGVIAEASVRYKRDVMADDGKTTSPSLEAMNAEELPEMNSSDPNGMQLLPILWTIPPDAIIDTTNLSKDEVCRMADGVLAAYGIVRPENPISQ